MNGAKDGNGQNKKARCAVWQGAPVSATVASSLIIVAATASQPALAGIQFKSYQTHTHIAATVDPSVNYQVERIERDGKLVGLRLILENVREELDHIVAQSDPRTENIKVSRAQDGSRVVYEFQLTDKAKAAGIEYFDYRNKAPSEIALDYWFKSQKLQPDSVMARTTPNRSGPRVPNKKSGSIKAAMAHAVAGNMFAGCGQPLSFGVDGGAKWKVYHSPYEYRKFFSLMPADVHYEYPLLTAVKGEKLGERAKEIAHYRLAFKLYKESKYALVLRTIEFFGAQYRKSELRNELAFLRASTLVQLSRLLRTDRYMDQAIDLHKRIVLEAPNTERARLSLQFIVQELMERGTPVFALEYALMGADLKAKDPKDISPWVFRLASAEALFALGEYDRAERAYQLIIDQNNALSPDAAFRMGEVYSARKFWERAVLAYEKALRQFSSDANRFPTAWFNLAEAYFRIDRLGDAEKFYTEFLKRFMNDSMAWAAQVRIAELEQMKVKAADPQKHDNIEKLYESVVNRYPYSPGAMMAELRLARCYRDLKPTDGTRQFLETFFSRRELKKFESSVVDMKDIEQWIDLAEANFHVANSNYRAALNRADEYRLKIGKIDLSDSFKKVYAEAIVGLATQLVDSDKDNSSELLAVVEHYGDLAPKPEPFSYVLAIAKANQLKKDYPATSEYLKILETRMQEATDLERDWVHLLKARQIKNLGGGAERMILELTQIREHSPLEVLKYDELALASVDKGDYRAAVAYDTRLLEQKDLIQKLTIEKRAEITVRRLENMTRFELPAEIARQADYALLKFGAQTQFAEILSRVRDLRARSLYDAGNFRGAVEAIDEILINQPNHPRRNEFEFMRGKGLTRIGREGEAVEAFRKLAQAAQNDVWKKSAQAELDQIQWENNVENQLKGTGGL